MASERASVDEALAAAVDEEAFVTEKISAQDGLGDVSNGEAAGENTRPKLEWYRALTKSGNDGAVSGHEVGSAPTGMQFLLRGWIDTDFGTGINKEALARTAFP